MILDPIAQALHQKSARGGVLAAHERQRLEQWYAKNDEEEMAMFQRSHQERVSKLQQLIHDISARIVEEAKRIQALEIENENIRGEIAKLESQLASRIRQPA